MSFTSTTFLLFLGIVFLVYYLVPKRMQWIILLTASFTFYFASSVKLSLFLVFSTLTTYAGARGMGSLYGSLANQEAGERPKQARDIAKSKARKLLTITLLANFGVLVFLKYFNFVSENIEKLFGLLGFELLTPRLNLLLPLGISFYTFQSVGYLIDVFRKRIKPEKNLFKYSLFVSYFPQIIQGPISRFDQLGSQLYIGHEFNYVQLKYGIQLALWGYFKKMVIADRAGFLVDTVFDNYLEYSGLYYTVAVIFYCVQIYADFSGGIDIVRGISQSLGIGLVDNFRRPYFARSVSEFWQRWHITLGTWMKDYVFYPLALTKTFGKLGRKARKRFGVFIGKQLPASLASLIVFILVGIWHGSSWKYVAFGLYHGLFILSASMLAPLFAKILARLRIDDKAAGWILFQILRTFLITAIGRFFSRGFRLKAAISMMVSSFRDFNPWILWDGSLLKLGIDVPNMLLLISSTALLFIVSLFQEKGYGMRETLAKQHVVFRWSVYFAGLFAVLIFGIYGQTFNVAKFIYQGF